MTLSDETEPITDAGIQKLWDHVAQISEQPFDPAEKHFLIASIKTLLTQARSANRLRAANFALRAALMAGDEDRSER